MPNKQEESYSKVFKVLKLAIMNSIEEVFPDCEISGSFFHLKKRFWRHVQFWRGLVSEYCDIQKEDNLVRLYTKMLACLAFVPVDDVVDTFVILKKESQTKLSSLYKYFEEIT